MQISGYQKSRRGEILSVTAIAALAVILVGTFIGTRRSIQDSAFRLFSFADGGKVRLHTPLSITDRGNYYLLSSSLCFTGVTVPSQPGRFWVHTEKRPDGIYAASTVQYIAPQTSIPYCGNDKDSSGKIKPNWRAWDFTLHINKQDAAFLCRSGLLFTSSSAFAVNEPVDMAGNSIAHICQNITPPACPFKSSISLKEKKADGTVEDMTDIDAEDVKWYAMNEKQIERHKGRYNPQTPDQNWLGFENGRVTRDLPAIVWPLKAASDDEEGRKYEYQKGARTCVKLSFDKELYEIDTANPGPSAIGASVKDKNVKDEICGLPIDCGLDYSYGWTMKKKAAPTPPASTSPVPPACLGPGWVDNPRDQLKSSAWFSAHKYGDCPEHNDGFWPNLQADCLVGDEGGGPTAQDKAKTAEPDNLYYKHLTPGDILALVPAQSLLQSQTLNDDTVKDRIRQIIIEAIRKDPRRFSSVSMDSVSVGLEGGRGGTTVRSLSIWVHPIIERIVTDAITTRERARLLYQPFIEGAVGQPVPLADVDELYTAALNRCGVSAIGGDQSGRGFSKQFGDYTAVVQNWSTTSPDEIFADFQDCNIHIVRTTACKAGSPPGGGTTVPSVTPAPGLACLLRDPDHVERCRPKNVDYKLQSSHTVRVSWDRMADPACEFDGYALDIVQPSGQGEIVCHRGRIPANENEGESRVSVGCSVRENTEGTSASIPDFKYDVPYTANVYLLKNEPPGCFSKGGHREFKRTPVATVTSSQEEPTTAPAQPTPTSFPSGKADAKGNFDQACCALDSDCPSGQKCNIGNAGCGAGFSCNENPNNPPPPARSPLPPSSGGGYCSREKLTEVLRSYLAQKGETLTQTQIDERVRIASCICNHESGDGNPFAPNRGCLANDPKHKIFPRDYSLGLFQLNIWPGPRHCPASISGLDPYAESKIACTIISSSQVNACEQYLFEPTNNYNEMLEKSGAMSNWTAWSGDRKICGF